jgi:WD40 repeat protein
MDGTIFVWDLKTSSPVSRIHKGGWVRDCVFSADGSAIFSCWTSNRLHCSDAATGRDLYSLKIQDPDRPDISESGTQMRLSDDGKTLVGVSQDLVVSGWDTHTHKQLFGRRRQKFGYWGALSHDAKVFAVPQDEPGSEITKSLGTGPILLEDVATGKPILTLPRIAGPTWPVAFCPDGRLLAINSDGSDENDLLRLWEVVAAGEALAIPTCANSKTAFSRDNRLLALVAPKQTILIWDLRQGRELRRITGFDSEVRSLAFAPDGRRLVAGLLDTTILVWDIDSPPQVSPTLDAQGAAQAWTDLAADSRKAFAARGALAGSPAIVVGMLKERLRPAPPVDAQRLGRLVTELGSDSFAARQKAQKALDEMGELANGAYQRMLSEKPSLEVRQRIEGLLQKARGPVTVPEKLQALRAVAVLEDIATLEAKELLETLAKGEAEARITQEAQASFRRLARR